MSTIDQAVELHQAGRLEEAERLYRQVLRSQPNHADALHLLGALVVQGGDPRAAVDLIERAIQAKPDIAEYHYSLGEALVALEAYDGAAAAYQKACALKPKYAEAYNSLGIALHVSGHLSQAITAFRQAVNVNPKFAEAHYNLGKALHEAGVLDGALTAYRNALTITEDFDVRNNIGVVLQELGHVPEAIVTFQRAVDLRPNFAPAHNNLGNALQAGGRLDEAVTAYRRALSLKPDYAAAYYNLGNALKQQDQLTEAMAAHQRALSLEPDSADAYNNLANVQLHLGEIEAAVAAYRKVLGLRPDPGTHSTLLLALQCREQCDRQDMFAEHRNWDKQYAAPLAHSAPPHAGDRDPNRPLRIGYVSPDFRTHSVAFFIEAVLATHDQSAYETFCYANVVRPDAVTQRLQGLPSRWRNILHLPDEGVCDLIRQDRIDILVDLAGHTLDNRLLVFARRPAPIQVTYLGYPNTTGLTTIDYRLTDSLADPPGESERFHTETLVRLPQGFLCYRPPRGAPMVDSLPAKDTGHITFGSFNAVAKVNDRVMALWSRILREIPDARLFLKARFLGDTQTQRRFEKRLAEHDVSPERVDMIGWLASGPTHLELYNRIDIALDSFPYNGTTTTCEALWMGVPVMTLAGDAHAGRVGVSLLTHVGLPELIAETPDAYVELAVDLARDLSRLQRLRQGLRAQVQHTSLTDAKGFTRTLEAAYRQMWIRYCESSGQ